MERYLLPGLDVEHAGRRWRVHRLLGPDAVLLKDEAGDVVSVEAERIRFPDTLPEKVASAPERPSHTEAELREAARRRDRLQTLAGISERSSAAVDEAARDLGLKRRRVWALLRQMAATGPALEMFLPRRTTTRAKRLSIAVEQIIEQAIEQHYAKPGRPSLTSLHRVVAARCQSGTLPAPSYQAVSDRVRGRDRGWLVRRRHGPRSARALRLLTGSHPGAVSPWERVQIDSTPCDLMLVREGDRSVIGRPTVTMAIDLYSRVVLGFSVSLEAASTASVATCIAHACLPKTEWLARRDLGSVHWPVYGRPRTLEVDQGPENEARGIQRGLLRYGITAKTRAPGHPEQHGTIERLLGTMMRHVHELHGSTFSSVAARGERDPAIGACLSLPELERILAIVVDSYHHTTHGSTGERPIERYVAWYRRPELPDAERVPPLLPADRLLLDFLPFERRSLTRTGVRLFRVDYSSVDLLPLWRRDNGRVVERVVVYDPRSLAQVWLLDEAIDSYIALPYRIPRSNMTLTESIAARRALQDARLQDRTENRLFDNLAKIRTIEQNARTRTSRHRAARARRRGTEYSVSRARAEHGAERQAVLVNRDHRSLRRCREPLMGVGRASHVEATTERCLSLGPAERIALINRDLWIGYGRAVAAHERLDSILRSERRMRPDNLLIVGASNNGKTAIARRFHARHSLPEDAAAERATIPVTLIQAPNGPRVATLLGSILAALGREPGRRSTITQLRFEACRAMRDVGLRLLLIDDLHNIRGSGMTSILVELREIGSAAGVSLGALAIREIAYVLRQDEQLANRFELMTLPRWQIEDVEYGRLLATLEQRLPLQKPSHLTEARMAEHLLLAANGLIGGVTGLVRQAAVAAIRSGRERIERSMLPSEYALPSSRIEAVADATDL